MSGVREVVVRADGRAWGASLGLPAEARAGGRGAPVVCVAHGFAQTADRYLSLIESLAGRGYVVVAPHASAHLLPSHSRYARQLRDSLLWACRTQPVADPSACALVGHSLGGGAAVLAAGLLAGSSRPRGSGVRLRAVVGLAPARTRPSSVAVAASGSLGALPGLVVVGSQDRIVPPSVSRALYDAWPGPRIFAEVAGGYHCGFVDSSSFGGFGCDSGDLPRAEQLAVVSSLVGDYLDSVLRGGPALVARPGVRLEVAGASRA